VSLLLGPGSGPRIGAGLSSNLFSNILPITGFPTDMHSVMLPVWKLTAMTRLPAQHCAVHVSTPPLNWTNWLKDVTLTSTGSTSYEETSGMEGPSCRREERIGFTVEAFHVLAIGHSLSIQHRRDQVQTGIDVDQGR